MFFQCLYQRIGRRNKETGKLMSRRVNFGSKAPTSATATTNTTNTTLNNNNNNSSSSSSNPKSIKIVTSSIGPDEINNNPVEEHNIGSWFSSPDSLPTPLNTGTTTSNTNSKLREQRISLDSSTTTLNLTPRDHPSGSPNRTGKQYKQQLQQLLNKSKSNHSGTFSGSNLLASSKNVKLNNEIAPTTTTTTRSNSSSSSSSSSSSNNKTRSKSTNISFSQELATKRRLARGFDPHHGPLLPPPITDMDLQALVQTLKKHPLPAISLNRMNEITLWMQGLGLPLVDGEGGYYQLPAYNTYNKSAAVPQSPLPLQKDRLRNGEILCMLFIILESEAATQCDIIKYIHSSPSSYYQALENIKRACWLFRMRKSPPLRTAYLMLPEEVMKGNKAVLWGLLCEIKMAYSSNGSNGSSSSSSSDSNTHSLFTSPVPSAPPSTTMTSINTPTTPNSTTTPKATSTTPLAIDSIDKNHFSHSGPIHPPYVSSVHDRGSDYHYNQEQRRMLDLSLLQWINSTGVLLKLNLVDANNKKNKNGMSGLPPTILAFERRIRDGTLLCALASHILKKKVMTIVDPKTYKQCLDNVHRCTWSLKSVTRMGKRYLHGGCEDDIVRGDWNTILGLLEDMHRLDTGSSSRSRDSERTGLGASANSNNNIYGTTNPLGRSDNNNTNNNDNNNNNSSSSSSNATRGIEEYPFYGLATTATDIQLREKHKVTTTATANTTTANNPTTTTNNSNNDNNNNNFVTPGVTDLMSSSSPTPMSASAPHRRSSGRAWLSPTDVVGNTLRVAPHTATGISRVQTMALNVSEEVKGQLLSDIQPHEATTTTTSTIPKSGMDLIPSPIPKPSTTTTSSNYVSRAGEDSDDGGSNVLTVPEWIEDFEGNDMKSDVNNNYLNRDSKKSSQNSNNNERLEQLSKAMRSQRTTLTPMEKKALGRVENAMKLSATGLNIDPKGVQIHDWLTRLGLAHEHYIGTNGRSSLISYSKDDNKYLPGGGDSSRINNNWSGDTGHWTDGVLLCRLVEKLERLPSSIAGTTTAPRNNAQKTQNIRRAFAELSGNGRLPQSRLHVFLEEALLTGKREETLEFLMDIKKAYAGRPL